MGLTSRIKIFTVFCMVALTLITSLTCYVLQERLITGEIHTQPVSGFIERPIQQNKENRSNAGYTHLMSNKAGARKASGYQNISFVHLLSYQRSGSSFAGGLFYTNPDAFYIYEPMDMLYSAMYGIPSGWTVPADIFYERSGKLRTLEEEELAMMTWTIERIFNCDLSSLPVAMLVSPFWESFVKAMPDTQLFVSCIMALKAKVKSPAKFCQQRLFVVCPRRFEPNTEKLRTCRDILWNNGTWTSSVEQIKKIHQKHRPFTEYFQCLGGLELGARHCAEVHLDKPCAKRSIRALKTVRVPMEVAARILEKLPESKVIQLLRDPRGAIRSRTRAAWSWGSAEGRSIRDHSSRYCPNALKDYQLLKQLGLTYMGDTMHVLYDGFVKDPQNTTKALYKVVDKPVSEKTLQWLNKQTVDRVTEVVVKKEKGKVITKKEHLANSTTVAVSWRSFYNYDEMQELRDECVDFFKLVDFEWE